MSVHDKLRKLQQRAETGPIVRDSTLYRILQHAARAIAKGIANSTPVAGKRQQREKH